MGEKGFDESKYQRLIAEFCQTNHHEILVNQEDVLNSIYTHMAHIDEPNGNGSAIPSFILAKEAKKEVSVLLNGRVEMKHLAHILFMVLLKQKFVHKIYS